MCQKKASLKKCDKTSHDASSADTGVTSDDALVENVTDVAGIEVGDARSDRKKSRS